MRGGARETAGYEGRGWGDWREQDMRGGAGETAGYEGRG